MYWGVYCKIKVGWRKLHSTFGGVGLFNFVTEQLIERLNLLLQQYGTGSVLNNKLDTYVAYLQLQLGVNCCPFDLTRGVALYGTLVVDKNVTEDSSSNRI